MKTLSDMGDVRGRYVLMRASLNVPLHEGRVRDSYRLEQALPTLRLLQEQGAKTIVIAHIGRDADETLQPVLTFLQQHIDIKWGGLAGSQECVAQRASLGAGETLLLENLRQDERETKNDAEFAELLAALAEVYVNDAFANSHREHASMVGVAARLPAYAGLNLEREIRELTPALQPATPAVFLLGGAKFATKLPLLERALETYDSVFVGGALLNDLLAAQGFEVGESLVSDISLAESAFVNHPKILPAVDVLVDGPRGRHVVAVAGVAPDEKILDIGPETVAKLAPILAGAQTILWNGPLGLYEGGADGGTQAVAKLVAAAPGHSIVGGGDTVAAIRDLGLNEGFGFVSTGGGAMLTFLEHGTTPALALLQ